MVLEMKFRVSSSWFQRGNLGLETPNSKLETLYELARTKCRN
jgi:hypothetical protein